MGRYEEIHIWDFPDKMYIKLPSDYRNSFFQLASLEFGTIANLQKVLKKNYLTTNIVRWRDEKDGKNEQLTNLKSLLFLRPYVVKRKNKILDVYSKVSITKDLRRVNKNANLIFLIKQVRHILRGDKNLSKSLNINPRTLNHYINNNKFKTIPYNLVLELFELIKEKIINFTFSPEELESQILSYRASHGKEIFPEFENDRKLPIKITPEFESILYHLMGDGHVARVGSSEYTQLNKLSKDSFLQKLFSSFGYFSFSKEGYKNGRIYISKTIIKLICKYYKIDSWEFGWNKSKLPILCLKRNNLFKLAGLIAFIVDEGHIGKSGITVYSSNKYLLSQIRKLTQDLALSCSEIKLKKRRGITKDSFRFYIYKESVEKILIKAKNLESLYPTCNFAQKKEKLFLIVTQ